MPEEDKTDSGHSRSWFDRSSPVIGSLIVHVTFLSLLGLISVSNSSGLGVNTIVTHFESQDNDFVENVTVADERQESPSEETRAVFNGAITSVDNVTHDVTPHSDLTDASMVTPARFSSGSASDVVAPVVMNATSGGGEGNGGNGTGSEGFFGLNLRGTSSVFVVDASSSMNFPHPGPAKTRFGRVKLELVKTIGNMTPADKFFLMFFNEVAIPMPATQLVSATPENQSMYLTWMAPGKAGGDTEPEGALLAAIALKPQVIYFLTDGRFKFSAVKAVKKANRHHVVINTICFGDDQGEKFLKQLAENNGGVYRFVPDEPETEDSSAEEDEKSALNSKAVLIKK